MNAYVSGLVAQVGLNTILAYSVYVILATGQLSLGNAGFMAIGAYTVAFLTVDRHVGLAPALLAGGLAAGLVGVIVVGFPSLRLRGIFLALATLGFGEIVRTFFVNFQPTGGAQGFSGLVGVPTRTIVLVTLAVMAFVAYLERSRLFLAFRAIRDDEDASRFFGLPATAFKVLAFGLGAFLAAVGGGLFAEFSFYIEPASFGFMVSVPMVLAVVLGGQDNLLGPPAGAVVFTLLPEVLRFLADWRYAVYGALLVAILAFRPQGLLPPLSLRRVHLRRRRPAPQRPTGGTAGGRADA
jgi:branched-chain amino acid transport system permease protein